MEQILPETKSELEANGWTFHTDETPDVLSSEYVRLIPHIWMRANLDIIPPERAYKGERQSISYPTDMVIRFDVSVPDWKEEYADENLYKIALVYERVRYGDNRRRPVRFVIPMLSSIHTPDAEVTKARRLVDVAHQVMKRANVIDSHCSDGAWIRDTSELFENSPLGILMETYQTKYLSRQTQRSINRLGVAIMKNVNGQWTRVSDIVGIGMKRGRQNAVGGRYTARIFTFIEK